MDYKYIEQLLERYWECQTTLEEEAILRAFFSQDDVPASLLPYRDLFVYEQSEMANDTLGEAFDRKVLSQIGSQEPVKVRRISFAQRLRPLYKAVAIVAVVLTLSNAIQMSINANHSPANVPEAGSGEASSEQMVAVDSLEIDSIHHTSLAPTEPMDINQIGKEMLPIN